MVKLRDRKAQLLEQPDLNGGGFQQVPATDYLVYPHQAVVRHHCQLIGVYPVGTADDKIPAVRRQEGGKHTLHPIGEGDGFRRNTDAAGRLAELPSFPDLLRRKTPAGSGVDNPSVGQVGS